MFQKIKSWLTPPPLLPMIPWAQARKCNRCDMVQLPSTNNKCLCGGDLLNCKVLEDTLHTRVVQLVGQQRNDPPLEKGKVSGWNPRSLLQKVK